jgi:CheY-like chemotaxis protein
VSGALSGSEGLELFANHHFDVVICDLGMPSMNGWEVGRRIKEACDERGIPKVPFILLTGWGGQMDETDKISESYVDEVLEKPIDIPDLVEIIGRVVSRTSVGPHSLP